MVGEVINQIAEVFVDVPVDLSDLTPVRQRTEQGQGEECLCGVIHVSRCDGRHRPPGDLLTVAHALRLCNPACPGSCDAGSAIGPALRRQCCPAAGAEGSAGTGVVATAGGAGEPISRRQSAGLAITPTALPGGIRGINWHSNGG